MEVAPLLPDRWPDTYAMAEGRSLSERKQGQGMPVASWDWMPHPDMGGRSDRLCRSPAPPAFHSGQIRLDAMSVRHEGLPDITVPCRYAREQRHPSADRGGEGRISK